MNLICQGSSKVNLDPSQVVGMPCFTKAVEASCVSVCLLLSGGFLLEPCYSGKWKDIYSLAVWDVELES